RLCWFRVSCSSLIHEGCDEPEILRYENLKSVPKVLTSDKTIPQLMRQPAAGTRKTAQPKHQGTYNVY
ncbi:MAG: hypothetical protein P8Q48_18110, partial [Paracoccaceae bacterium]|nr:hypothetical protein [Paracoccaceae bacterium]